MDKRKMLCLLAEAKEHMPEKLSLIESIEAEFHSLFESITPRQKLMLRSFPLQYVKKIPQEEGEWTSQLHIWAEEGVPEILKLDPVFLAFKNSLHESVLMSFAIGATGTHTGIVRYDLIQQMLERDYAYQEEVKDKEGNIQIEDKNVLDEVDINDQTLLDYLIDIAFATGTYQGEEPDLTLQQIMRNYLAVMEQVSAQVEEVPLARMTTPEVNPEVEEAPSPAPGPGNLGMEPEKDVVDEVKKEEPIEEAPPEKNTLRHYLKP